MSNQNQVAAGSAGFSTLSLLGVAFVILKLCKVIDWSWWWVTLPFWGGLVIVVPLGLIALLIVWASSVGKK
jgi:hypothetical protein